MVAVDRYEKGREELHRKSSSFLHPQKVLLSRLINNITSSSKFRREYSLEISDAQ